MDVARDGDGWFADELVGDDAGDESGPTFKADTYTLSESGGPSGYTASVSTCTNGVTVTSGQITLANGQSTVCTINNDDIAPLLTLHKSVINDNGGGASATDWTLTATGTGGSPTNLSGTTPVASGPTFKADTYTLSESGGPSGYLASAYVCTNGVTVTSGQITLANGQTTVCTITNDDIAPSLTLDKIVMNDNGGLQPESAWTIKATGTVVSPTNLSGPGAAGYTDVVSGPTFKADTYTLSETGPAGYVRSVWTCTNGVTVNGSSQITLANGQTTVCTITNDDIQPTITVTKVLSPASDPGRFNLRINSTTYKANAGNGDTTGAVGINAGTYTVDETAVAPANLANYTSTIDCGARPGERLERVGERVGG